MGRQALFVRVDRADSSHNLAAGDQMDLVAWPTKLTNSAPVMFKVVVIWGRHSIDWPTLPTSQVCPK